MVADVGVQQGHVGLEATVGSYGGEERLGVEAVDVCEAIHVGREVAPA